MSSESAAPTPTKSKKPEELPWEAVPGIPNLFKCEGASYWHGQKGWWADKGDGIFHGPFRGWRIARACAEEGARKVFEERRHKQEKAKHEREQKRAKLQAEAAEMKARATWGDLPPKTRALARGQVWEIKHPKLQGRQLLVVEVRTSTILVLVRTDQIPWTGARRDTYEIASVPRLFRYVGRATVPRSA